MHQKKRQKVRFVFLKMTIIVAFSPSRRGEKIIHFQIESLFQKVCEPQKKFIKTYLSSLRNEMKTLFNFAQQGTVRTIPKNNSLSQCA